MSSANFSEQNNTRSATLIWALLVILTLMSFAMAESGMAGPTVMLLVLGATFIKGQLVAGHFMGLRRTRLLWRVIMASYLLIVGAMIAMAYLMGAH